MNKADGTAPRNKVIAEMIEKLTGAARSCGISDAEIATELLVAAYGLAAGTIHSAEWAAALEKGAALARAGKISERTH